MHIPSSAAQLCYSAYLSLSIWSLCQLSCSDSIHRFCAIWIYLLGNPPTSTSPCRNHLLINKKKVHYISFVEIIYNFSVQIYKQNSKQQMFLLYFFPNTTFFIIFVKVSFVLMPTICFGNVTCCVCKLNTCSWATTRVYLSKSLWRVLRGL